MEKETHNKMEASISNSVTWDEIDLSESYLVCGKFEEAAAMSSSILARLQENKYVGPGDENVLLDMMESAAMVLVQSWRESGRTTDLLNEVKSYFGSVTAIPVQVVVTSACVEAASGQSSGVRAFIEDFLAKWTFDIDKYYVVSHPDVKKSDMGARNRTLEIDQYREVVEFYALTLLGNVLNDVDSAVLWVEKAQLPEEVRQDLLRRLVSLSQLKSTSSPQVSSSLVDESESHPLFVKEIKQSEKPMMVLDTQCHNGVDGMKVSVWQRLQNIIKRCRNAVVASNGKFLLGCLIFLICYFIQKKRDTIMRAIQRRALSLKQAVVDLWQLAFSYQVNPLAAVQPLPPANRSR